MIKREDRNALRIKRHYKIRNKVSGTASRPRLSVFRSLNYIYVQAIDDTVGNTIAAASSADKDLAAAVAEMTKTEAAKAVGEKIAKALIAKGVTAAVYDRGGYIYQGRVAALAEGAREAGLQL